MSGDCLSPSEILEMAGEPGSGARQGRLAAHLTECQACARAVEEAREVIDKLREAATSNAPDAFEECPQWELAAAYADGTLSADEEPEIEGHIACCPWCMALVCDLWRPHESQPGPVEDSAVARVLASLARAARTSVLRLSGGALSLVRGFAAGVAEASGSGVYEPAPVAAGRGGGAVQFGWNGAADVTLDCEVRLVDESPMLIGRVAVGGKPARSLSVALRSRDSGRGPESPDALGRFGPWRLEPGLNALVLSGAPLSSGRAELAIELWTDADGQ